MSKAKRFLLGAIVLTAVAFPGFSNGKSDGADSPVSAEKETAVPETLVVAVQKLPIAAISAMAENSNVAQRIDFNVEETLIKTDYYDEFKFKPGLAESWELVDDTTLVFKLRKGVKFHNGEELTAEDVAFTFGEERFMKEDAPAKPTTGAFLSNIKSVTALDDYTVEVKAYKRDALLITRFASFPTQIISEKAYRDVNDF